MRFDIVQNRVNEAKSGNADAMERLSSQKDVRLLSDDPTKATQIIRLRDSITDVVQFQKNIDYSKGLLEVTENSLERMGTSLIRAKELAIGMANDTNDAKAKEATSREIREIMNEVVQIANTTFKGRFVFGGFRNQTPPLSLDGDFLGDDGQLYLQVSSGDFRQVNMPGRYLFEASPDDRQNGHFNMVHALEVLFDGMVSNDKTAIHKAMSELDHQIEKTTSSQATVGSQWNSLKSAQDRLALEEVSLRTNLSKVQDADFYNATSEFKRTETTLQSTLLSSTKLLQPSLLNFLQ
jgi:flagellar hook-associated protein 3 FlgL